MFTMIQSRIAQTLAVAGLALSTSLASAQEDAAAEQAKKIASGAGCFTCHTIAHQDSKDGKLPIGPAWQDVAKQYAGKPGAADFLTRVVLEGSNPYSSHWKGKAAGIAMPPNAVAITESDTRKLVYWILSLK